MAHTCIYGDENCKECVTPPGRSRFHKAQWPITSDALGVHPSQIPEAMEQNRKLGIRMEFTKDGSAVLESLAHRDRCARALGMTDISKREITEPKHRTMRERSLGPSR